jgi:hypothetical protein
LYIQDGRGRPKTSLSNTIPVKSLPNLIKSPHRGPAGLPSNTYGHFEQSTPRKTEGLAKKFHHLFDKSVDTTTIHHGLYPSCLNLEFPGKQHKIVPPINDLSSVRDDKSSEADPLSQIQKAPDYQAVQKLGDILDNQASSNDIPNLSQDSSSQSLLKNLEQEVLLNRLFPPDATVIEPLASPIDWSLPALSEPSFMNASTNVPPLKPLMSQYELDRQNRVATVIAETQLESRFPPVTISTLDPIPRYPNQLRAAGVKSSTEPRKRKFQHRYRSLEGTFYLMTVLTVTVLTTHSRNQHIDNR